MKTLITITIGLALCGCSTANQPTPTQIAGYAKGANIALNAGLADYKTIKAIQKTP
jgi:hypothetical protein